MNIESTIKLLDISVHYGNAGRSIKGWWNFFGLDDENLEERFSSVVPIPDCPFSDWRDAAYSWHLHCRTIEFYFYFGQM